MTEKFNKSVEMATRELTNEGLDQLAWFIDAFVQFYLMQEAEDGDTPNGRRLTKRRLQ